MKIEEQCVSLDLAKEMNELGVTRDSLWWWTWMEWNEKIEWVLIHHKMYKEQFSAYTVAELGEMLPIFVSSAKATTIPSIGYRCTFDVPPSKIHYEDGPTEAEARAKMMIYLINEGWIKTRFSNKK